MADVAQILERLLDDTDIEMEELDRQAKTEPITEQFTNDIFDDFFNLIIMKDQEKRPLKKDDDIPIIKKDCMWAGSLESDTHQDLFEEFFGSSTASAFDYDILDDFDFSNGDPFRQFTSLDQEEGGGEEEVEDSIDMPHTTLLKNIVLSNHSYAFNGIGPIPQHPSASQQPLQGTAAEPQSVSSSSSLFSSSSAEQALQGIVTKEEVSEDPSTKKTKILVPLKDLIETLQQKTFHVTPLGPGKKVIRLTGHGVIDFGGAQFKSSLVSCSSITAAASSSVSSSVVGHCSSRALSTAKKTNPRKPASKKMKKAIHKPKQELSPSSPVRGSSLASVSSHCGNNNFDNNSPMNDKPKKTKAHNGMERLRRIELKNSFDKLKTLVPALKAASKASKVEILKKSTEFINTVLKATEESLIREEHYLKVKNETLRNRVAYLSSLK